MHIVLEYLLKRVEKLGVVKTEQSNLFVALDEAFVNAVKHGNKFDSRKLIRITAEVSKQEARFTIEDEGEGFDVNNIPDPLDPENLFKTSGRGVLFIYNIMDEVKYNERGNRLTMVKRARAKCRRYTYAGYAYDILPLYDESHNRPDKHHQRRPCRQYSKDN